MSDPSPSSSDELSSLEEAAFAAFGLWNKAECVRPLGLQGKVKARVRVRVRVRVGGRVRVCKYEGESRRRVTPQPTTTHTHTHLLVALPRLQQRILHDRNGRQWLGRQVLLGGRGAFGLELVLRLLAGGGLSDLFGEGGFNVDPVPTLQISPTRYGGRGKRERERERGGGVK
jgi:hypothetical protein